MECFESVKRTSFGKYLFHPFLDSDLWIPLDRTVMLYFSWPSRVLDESVHHREWLSLSVAIMMCHRLVDTKRHPEHDRTNRISSWSKFSSSWVVDIKFAQLFNQRIGPLSWSKANVCWLQKMIDCPNS